MKTIILTLAIAAAIFVSQNGLSQNKHYGNNEIKFDKSFQISGKSRTLKMKKGENFNLALELKKDRAYYISVNGNKALADIQYKLVSDCENSQILYDNSAYEFNNQAIVGVAEDSKVMLQITTQPSNYLNPSASKKEVEIIIASKKVKSSAMDNVIVLASNN